MALVISRRLSVEVQQCAEIELGLLEKLDLADMDLKIELISYQPSQSILRSTNILQRVDSLGRLLNLTTDNFRDELGSKLGESAASSLALYNLGHLLPNGPDLRRTSIGGLLDLVGASLGECDGKQSNQVIISSLDGDISLDQRLPLANQRAQLVRSEVQSMEVGQTILSLNLIHTELNLAECVVLVVLQIGKGDLEDSALQRVVGVLKTTGTVDKRLSNTDISVSNTSRVQTFW